MKESRCLFPREQRKDASPWPGRGRRAAPGEGRSCRGAMFWAPHLTLALSAPEGGGEGSGLVCSKESKVQCVVRAAKRRHLSLSGRGRRGAPGEGRLCRRATSEGHVVCHRAPCLAGRFHSGRSPSHGRARWSHRTRRRCAACGAPYGRPSGSPIRCAGRVQDRAKLGRCVWGRGTAVPCLKTASTRPYDEPPADPEAGQNRKTRFLVGLVLTKAAVCVVQDAPYSV